MNYLHLREMYPVQDIETVSFKDGTVNLELVDLLIQKGYSVSMTCKNLIVVDRNSSHRLFEDLSMVKKRFGITFSSKIDLDQLILFDQVL